MPRPPLKRRRSNKQSSNRPNRAPLDAGLTSAPRVKLQQQLAKKAIGQRPQDSDDSDKLVTRTRHGRHKRNVEEVFASGGVAKGDKAGVFPTKEERSTRLRSETNEMIRRSRSKSTESTNEKPSKSRTNSATSSKVDGASSPALNAQILVPRSPQSTLPKSQPPLAGETSMLGTLKPRKRQASILHMIDNNDSSLVNPEDEEQFLPDNESTPLNSRRPNGEQSASRLATGIHGSISRKRKLGVDEPETTNEGTPPSSILQRETTTPDNTSLPSKSSKKRGAPVDDDDIMAPPQSSSSESSPQKPKPSVAAKSKKLAPIPTTEQLQSLMPSKRRKGSRHRNQATEFDIPEDSDRSSTNQVEDESTFLPRKYAAKSRSTSKKPPLASISKPKAKSKARMVIGAGATPAAKPKPNSKSTSTPLTVVAPRTPLPLTRNANQENKAMTLARGRDAKFISGGQTDATPQGTNAKQSGGSRLRRGLRGALNTGAESDKENSASGPGRSLRKRTLAPNPEAGTQSTQAVPDTDDAQSSPEVRDEEMEIDPEQDVQITPGTTATGHGGSVDAKVWKHKWADIDSWSLDYEEVDISTGSSSPLMKVSAV